MKAAVLLGAGASVSGRVPLASELVKKIDEQYPDVVAGCERNYCSYMQKLPAALQDALLRPYLESAKVGPGYLALARCVRDEYVDVILNVNFDHLAEEALRLAQVDFHTVDIPNSRKKVGTLSGFPTLVYLHGKFGGDVNIHTPGRMQEVLPDIEQVLRDTIGVRPLIVVGYSGEVDPIFELLHSTFPPYRHGLYWESPKRQPATDVLNRLLSKLDSGAYFVGGIDADALFAGMADGLALRKLPVLDDFRKYYSTLTAILDAPIRLDAERLLERAMSGPQPSARRVRASKPKRRASENLASIVHAAWKRDDYETLAGLSGRVQALGDAKLTEVVSWGLYNRGTSLAAKSMELPKDRRAKTLVAASADLKSACRLNPSLTGAHVNYGRVLIRIASRSTNRTQQRRLLGDAISSLTDAAGQAPALSTPFEALAEAHERLSRIADSEAMRLRELHTASDLYWRAHFNSRDDIDVLNNWAIVLTRIGEASYGTEKRDELTKAREKLEAAVRLAPDEPGVRYNLGIALHTMAAGSSPSDAIGILTAAVAAYAGASRLAPHRMESEYNRGVALLDLRKLVTDGARRDEVLTEARDAFQKAVDCCPDSYEAHYNLGNTMMLSCESQPAPDRIELLTKAIEHHGRAASLRPRAADVRNNQGVALLSLAVLSEDRTRKRRLLRRAIRALDEAQKLGVLDHRNLLALAETRLQLANTEAVTTRISGLTAAIRDYDRAIARAPTQHIAFVGRGSAWLGIASVTTGVRRAQALERAVRDSRTANSLERGAGDYNLACAAVKRGKKSEALRLLSLALATDRVKPEYAETDDDLRPLWADARFKAVIREHRTTGA